MGLVVERGTLKVTATSDAETPLVYGQRPLLTIDLWEHAYCNRKFVGATGTVMEFFHVL